jgi:hypothetical protein
MPAPGADYRDEYDRFLPGVVPGWGMSWWFAEQRIERRHVAAMTPEERLTLVCRYWREVAAGWRPAVSESL